MPVIKLQTLIDTAPEICFDLSLNIDLHMQSMKQSNEKAIGGRMSGQIKLGETVKWKARHFGIYFTMTSLITELIRPEHFTDEMIKGPFQHLHHQHIFEKTSGGTMMTDYFEFQSPFWILGNIADRLFLKRYLRNLLTKRNELIKNTAEHNKNTPL